MTLENIVKVVPRLKGSTGQNSQASWGLMIIDSIIAQIIAHPNVKIKHKKSTNGEIVYFPTFIGETCNVEL